MRNTWLAKGLVFLGLGVMVGALVWWGVQRFNRPASAAPELGKRAPGFNLPVLWDEPTSLVQYQGKVVLVNFWATWCPPCKAEMPLLEAVYEQYGDRLVVLAVNQEEPEDKVKLFAAQYGLKFPVLMDPRGEVGAQYLVDGLPTTFIIDEDGIIQGIQSGLMTEDAMAGHLRKVGLLP